MDDKEFRESQRRVKVLRKKQSKPKHRIITRRRGIWNIPDNF